MKLVLSGAAFALLLSTQAFGQAMPSQDPVPSQMPAQTPTPQNLPDGTAGSSPNGVQPNGTTAPNASTNAPLPPSTTTCKPGQITGECAPAPNPNCLPGQSPQVGTSCPPPTLPNTQ